MPAVSARARAASSPGCADMRRARRPAAAATAAAGLLLTLLQLVTAPRRLGPVDNEAM
jgi:hypothetical protein